MTDLDRLIQDATLAADMVACAPHPNEAARTRAIVQRSLEFLLGNKLIEITDSSEWPQWLVLDPPFSLTGRN